MRHPLKAGHLFVCHSERSEESVPHRPEILRFAQNDKQRIALLSRLKWVAVYCLLLNVVKDLLVPAYWLLLTGY